MNKIITILFLLVSFIPSAFAAGNPVDAKGPHTGQALEVINSGGYSYVLLETESGNKWMAGPGSYINPGDRLIIREDGIPMENFHSKSLNRDFDVIYFVNRIENLSAPATAPQPDKSTVSNTKSVATDLNIERAEGGKTVGEIFEQRDELAGQRVVLRGKVVKFSSMIMGKNWLHIQDGTRDSETGENDITVTTSQRAEVGDLVVINATVMRDKDFGFGYRYDVILEEATLEIE